MSRSRQPTFSGTLDALPLPSLPLVPTLIWHPSNALLWSREEFATWAHGRLPEHFPFQLTP